MSSTLDDNISMIGNFFYTQLQDKLYRWLKTSNNDGYSVLDSMKIVMSSTLGNRAENQDRVIYLRVSFGESRKPGIAALILCDGMGGMVNGSDCAEIAISNFAASLVHANNSTLVEKLTVAANKANRAVYDAYHGDGGSTLSVVACDENNEWAALNVGDSRIYEIFNDGVVKQLTVDDTLAKQLEDLHLLSPPPEFRQLLQFIGMGEGIEPRYFKLKSSSEIKYFLLTSDGAHNIPENIFHKLIKHADMPKDIALRLCELSEWLGGKDNSTVAVLTNENVFISRKKELDLNSLELWSISGKLDFLSITSNLQDNGFGDQDNNNQDIKDADKQEQALEHGKLIKIKNKPETDLKIKNKNNQNNTVKKEVEKPTPQLSIDFSEEK